MALIDALKYVWPKCSKETREEIHTLLTEAMLYRVQRQQELMDEENDEWRERAILIIGQEFFKIRR